VIEAGIIPADRGDNRADNWYQADLVVTCAPSSAAPARLPSPA
jgi:hypothetical protein